MDMTMEDDEDDALLLQTAAQVDKQLNARRNKNMEFSYSPESPIKTCPDDALNVLRQYFGHNDFRPNQWKIIDSVVQHGRDQLIIMATGCGKSLCYQFISLYKGGVTFVISPLISLMEDQVQALNVAGIDSCFLGSAQRDKSAYLKVKEGRFKIVYLTPEYVTTDTGQDLIDYVSKSKGVPLIAIDEAHCISQWGHDFRSSYRKLGTMKRRFPNIPFMALTATATPVVRKDIVKNLDLVNPSVTCTSFDRPNLFLEVFRKEKGILEDLKRFMTFSSDKGPRFVGATIIYCPTKKIAEGICMVLDGVGVNAELYHAGLTASQRTFAHKRFINDECEVIVATVAFGMGIDKPDVRRVIHYGAPKDIESYYQEIGRAGRDGSPSICSVLYNNSDFVLTSFFLKEISSKKFREYKKNMYKKMQDYLVGSTCRRKFLLSHFEGETDENSTEQIISRCCDICLRKKANQTAEGNVLKKDSEAKDYQSYAEICFRIIEALKGRYGVNILVQSIRGSHDKRVPSYMYTSEFFGRGQSKSDKWWKAFIAALSTNGFLTEKIWPNSYAPSVCLSDKSRLWLMQKNKKSDKSFPLVPTDEMSQLEAEEEAKLKRATQKSDSSEFVRSVDRKSLPVRKLREYVGLLSVPTTSSAGSVQAARIAKLQNALFNKLLAKRTELARDAEVAPYMVATNRALSELAVIRPSNLAMLTKIEDFPQTRIDRFGNSFIEVIENYCREHSELSFNNTSKETHEANLIELSEADNWKLACLSPTVQESYRLVVLQQKSLVDVATQRQLAESTIAGHIADAIRKNLPVNVEALGISKDIRDSVFLAIRSPEINSDISRLGPIKDKAGDRISWAFLKICIAIFEYEYGLTADDSTMDAVSTPQTPSSPQPASEDSFNSVPNLHSAEANAEKSEQRPMIEAMKRKVPAWMTSSQPSFVKKPKSTVFK